MPCRALPAILTVAATLVAGTALADDVSGTVTEINKGTGTLTINGQEVLHDQHPDGERPRRRELRRRVRAHRRQVPANQDHAEGQEPVGGRRAPARPERPGAKGRHPRPDPLLGRLPGVPRPASAAAPVARRTSRTLVDSLNIRPEPATIIKSANPLSLFTTRVYLPGGTKPMRVFSASIPAVAGLLLAATTAPALAAGVTELVSLGQGRVQGDGASFSEFIRRTERIVAFPLQRHQPGAGRHQRREGRLRPRPPDGQDRPGKRPLQRRPGERAVPARRRSRRTGVSWPLTA